MRWRTFVAAAALVAAGFTAHAVYQRALAQEAAEQGRAVFMAQGCYGCHTVRGIGTPIGPDLSHLGGKYSTSFLKRWLRDPALQRPAAHMPKLELSEPDVEALTAFLASLD